MHIMYMYMYDLMQNNYNYYVFLLSLQEMIKDFDRSYNELIGGCLEKIQAQSVCIEQYYTCIA